MSHFFIIFGPIIQRHTQAEMLFSFGIYSVLQLEKVVSVCAIYLFADTAYTKLNKIIFQQRVINEY